MEKPEIDNRLRIATERVSRILQDGQPHPDHWHAARADLIAAMRDRPERQSDAERLAYFEVALARFDLTIGPLSNVLRERDLRNEADQLDFLARQFSELRFDYR